MGVKRKEIRGTAGVKSEATPSVQWRSGVPEFQHQHQLAIKRGDFRVIIHVRFWFSRAGEVTDRLFKTSSGHRQLPRLHPARQDPGLISASVGKQLGHTEGSFICVPPASEHQGSQRSGANSANEQTELSPSSHVSKKRTK